MGRHHMYVRDCSSGCRVVVAAAATATAAAATATAAAGCVQLGREQIEVFECFEMFDVKNVLLSNRFPFITDYVDDGLCWPCVGNVESDAKDVKPKMGQVLKESQQDNNNILRKEREDTTRVIYQMCLDVGFTKSEFFW